MGGTKRRRDQRKRARGRHPGLYKALSALLILAAVGVACVIFFRVEDIEVTGNRRYTAQEIIDIAGVERGDNLFAIQAASLSRAVQSRLPYVRTVSVRRLLPDRLVIAVTEGKAVAAIAQEGRWWLLDEDGKLLEQAASAGECAKVTGITPLAPAVGTYLAGGEEQQLRVARLKELLGTLADNGLADKLWSVDMGEDYQLTFVLDGRFTVHISPTLERGLDYWIKRLGVALQDARVSANQDYTVEIMDDTRIRFIPG